MHSSLFKQIVNFLLFGGTAFLIDFALLYALTEWVGLPYLASAFVSFIAAATFNYYATVHWVFSGGKLPFQTRFAVFIALGVTALLLNELGMMVFVEWVGLFYMHAKIVVTILVTIFNFITRKYFFD